MSAKWLRSWPSTVLTTTLLAGCATGLSEPLPVLRPVCPPLVQYDRDFQKRAAEELSKLPPASALAVFMNDYVKLRDACRAMK
jgi:hypothetical protein